MLYNRFAISFLILVFNLQFIDAQTNAEPQEGTYRIVFYNVENFFDVMADSTSGYNEFTPDGDRHWTYHKYKTKRNQIYKVITAIGKWQSPAIIAFAEIENKFVLDDLINDTPLWNQHYKVLHYESNDHRGIDVGLLYHAKQVELIDSKTITLKDENGKALATRDILYAKCLLASDTLHLFINHWPSRYGGTLQTTPLRELAAFTLINSIDSVCKAVNQPNILIMGDFNDDPDDASISILTDSGNTCRLTNLEHIPAGYPVKGTLKYQAEWNTFDQVLCSAYLIQSKTGFGITDTVAHVFSPLFLLEEDEKYLGMKPKRTYIGFKYHGGFSDHLPVYVDIYHINR